MPEYPDVLVLHYLVQQYQNTKVVLGNAWAFWIEKKNTKYLLKFTGLEYPFFKNKTMPLKSCRVVGCPTQKTTPSWHAPRGVMPLHKYSM